jgi:acetoin utilization deacetylase AcuC-like enzyme
MASRLAPGREGSARCAGVIQIEVQMKPLVYSHSDMLRHEPGAGHPERPDRLRAVEQALEGAAVERRTPRVVAREALLRVHPAAFVDSVLALAGQQAVLDGDTVASPGTVGAALLAAGAAVELVDALVGGEAQRGFALVRPPGHHAEAERAMGFCFFNNVAVAAAHARALGVERVLVVDWDVHHGNGTQDVFYARDDVLFFSVHQSPLYPGTGMLHEVGTGAGAGFTVNAPMPAGLGDGDYTALFRDVLRPVADAFKPGLVLVSAGFDAHRDDPLGGMRLSEEGFAVLCAEVAGIAADHAGGRLALVLEGGYDLRGLARSVRACVDVLGGATAPTGGDHAGRVERSAAGKGAVEAARRAASRFWRV